MVAHTAPSLLQIPCKLRKKVSQISNLLFSLVRVIAEILWNKQKLCIIFLSLSDSSSHILDSKSPDLWRTALKHPAHLLLPELHIPELFSSTQLGPWPNDFIIFSLMLKEQVTKKQKHTNKICTSCIHRILNASSFRHI